MATNYEQIQSDLLKCNITMWEPDPLASVQLSTCRLGCMISEVDSMLSKVTDAANALVDIETISTSKSGLPDLKFVISSVSTSFAWSMIPNTKGIIEFDYNDSSKFFNKYILPNVSTLLVPIQEDDGTGTMVARDPRAIESDRMDILTTKPMDVVETTITALTSFKKLLSDKKTQLEADYSKS